MATGPFTYNRGENSDGKFDQSGREVPVEKRELDREKVISIFGEAPKSENTVVAPVSPEITVVQPQVVVDMTNVEDPPDPVDAKDDITKKANELEDEANANFGVNTIAP